MGNRFGKRPLW